MTTNSNDLTIELSPELQALINKLVLERPEKDGRPVPPELYEQAMIFIQKPPERKMLFCSQDILERLGRDNILFCGHWIYPKQQSGEYPAQPATTE